jgi:hypothetical protein
VIAQITGGHFSLIPRIAFFLPFFVTSFATIGERRRRFG